LTTPSHKILQMAAVLSAMGSAQATPPRVELPPLAKLIGQLRKDAALRVRFSLDPRAVFEETGIDPTPYDLPERLDETDVDRFLSDWTGARGPAAGSRSPEHPRELASEAPAAAPGDPHASGDEEKIPLTVPPVAPVYGPPPGIRTPPLPEPVSPPSPAPQPDEPPASGDAPPSRHRSWHRSEHRAAPVAPGPAPAFLTHTPVYGPPPGFRSKP
jgi:hypothetical protein